jgi:hypothetical protein
VFPPSVISSAELSLLCLDRVAFYDFLNLMALRIHYNPSSSLVGGNAIARGSKVKNLTNN